MTESTTTATVRAIFVAGALALPFLFYLYVLRGAGVNLPVMDQWEFVPLFQKWAAGSLTFADLYAQQNEFRQFFPELIFIALGARTGWDTRAEMVLTFFLQVIVALCVYVLARKTLRTRDAQGLVALLLVYLVLSPIQFENWLQGVQLIYIIPNAALCLVLLLAVSSLPNLIVSLLSILLAGIATFSSANGILLWLIAPIALLLMRADGWSSVRRRLLPSILLWGSAGLLAFAAYIYDYRTPSTHSGPGEALAEPLGVISHLVAWAGRPVDITASLYLEYLPVPSVPITQLFGFMLALALGVIAVRSVRDRSDFALLRQSAPWWALLFYGLGTGVLVAIARHGLSRVQALAWRYTSFSLWLYIACIALALLVYERLSPSHRRVLRTACVLFSLCILVNSVLSLAHARKYKTDTLRGKACLALINVAPDDKCLRAFVYPDVALLRERANVLDKLGLLTPPLWKPAAFESNFAPPPEPNNNGWIDGFSWTRDGATATGWAVLPSRGEPADLVLLTPRGEPRRILGLAFLRDRRHIVDRILKRPAVHERANWDGTFPPPSDWEQLEIVAWGLDAQTGRANPLNGIHRIPPKKTP